MTGSQSLPGPPLTSEAERVGDVWTLFALLAATLFGACLAGAMVSWYTHVPRRTPEALRGRVVAASEMLLSRPYIGCIALGATLVGVVDYRVLTIAGGLALAGCAVRIGYSRSRMIAIAS